MDFVDAFSLGWPWIVLWPMAMQSQSTFLGTVWCAYEQPMSGQWHHDAMGLSAAQFHVCLSFF